MRVCSVKGVSAEVEASPSVTVTVAANLRIAGALEKSTQVMVSMQQLVKVPEIMATMREMSKEMMKVGQFWGWTDR